MTFVNEMRNDLDMIKLLSDHALQSLDLHENENRYLCILKDLEDIMKRVECVKQHAKNEYWESVELEEFIANPMGEPENKTTM